MVGIEHFRALTTMGDLENRRVTVDQNTQEIRAPNSLWGRFVNWIKGTSGPQCGGRVPPRTSLGE
jgi:hypothetical protein